MKRVGELYEVVVFTASVSKVSNNLLDCPRGHALTFPSMVTRFLTSWTFIRLSIIDCSERVAITTRATT